MPHQPIHPPRTIHRQPVDPAAYARTFEHGDGAAILDELITVFTRSAVTEGGIDAVLKTYHRAGASAVLNFILAKINAANGVPPNEDPDES